LCLSYGDSVSSMLAVLLSCTVPYCALAEVKGMGHSQHQMHQQVHMWWWNTCVMCKVDDVTTAALHAQYEGCYWYIPDLRGQAE